jgi:hypothetical protein
MGMHTCQRQQLQQRLLVLVVVLAAAVLGRARGQV